MRVSSVFVVACVLLLGASQVQAGINFGKLKKYTPVEQRYFNHVPAQLMKEEDLPKNFDWGNVSGVNYLAPNWNQHIPKYCGSCFLHATLSMIQDRLKIAKGARAPDVMLGRQTFLNCAPLKGFSDGCNGGDVIDVVRYMAEHGLPDEGCMPYRAEDYSAWTHKKHGTCPDISFCTNCMPDEKGRDRCWAIKTPMIYKVSSYGQVGPTEPTPDNVAHMMSEIYQRGPITCSITCPDDFVYNYDGGIYRDTSGDTDVDHDIEIVGWGEENGVKYWKIRNSWGQYWGVSGFFRVERGINNQMIENGDCWYATPTFDMEAEVDAGELVGSMDGLKPRNKMREISKEQVMIKGQQAQVIAAEH